MVSVVVTLNLCFLNLEEEEEEEGCLEDSGYAAASQCSHSAEPEEDWEANI